MGNYSTRRGRPLGVSEQGAAATLANMNLFALDGESEIVSVHDDFNGYCQDEHFGGAAIWETQGWALTDAGTTTTPVGDYMAMNDGTVDADFYSCIHIYAGTAADEGGNAQLLGAGQTLPASSGGGEFPHIWIPTSGMDTEVLDKTCITFACRVGIVSDANACDGKFFIGFAEVGDTSIIAPATGILTIASAGALFGFHFNADSQDTLRFVSHRTAATVMAEGTNFTELTDSIDTGYGTASKPRWFDLSFRMVVNNMSDNANNGFSAAAWREVGTHTNPGNEGVSLPGEGYNPYALSTILTNQTPNSATMLVPTIELINGPAQLTQMKLDWWSMGISRYSLKTERADNF